jgi:hypothetical protein
MIAGLGAYAKWNLDDYRWENELPNVGLGDITNLIAAQGAADTVAAGGTPLPLAGSYAGVAYSGGYTVQLFYDGNGGIVDGQGNAQDPFTGNSYSDELVSPVTQASVTGSAIKPPTSSNPNVLAAHQSIYQQMLTAMHNFIVNAATGALSQDQKNQLIQQEQAGLVTAGMDSTAAANWAQYDVTNALVAAHADPSQASVINSPGVQNVIGAGTSQWLSSYGKYLLWGAVGIGGLIVIGSMVKR